jgi:hypothetical protein
MRAERPLFCAVTKTGRVTGEGLPRCCHGPESFSGHSLRRGLLTAGGENQAQLADLLRPVAAQIGREGARLHRTRRPLAAGRILKALLLKGAVA